MKAFLCSALVASASSKITFSYEDCSDAGAHAKLDLDNVKVDPPVPEAGDTITISIPVTMDKEITDMQVSTDGVLKKTFDGCDGLDMKLPLNLGHITNPPAGCPLAVGEHEKVITLELSKNLPSGLHKTSKATAVDQDGESLYCLSMTWALEKDEDVEQTTPADDYGDDYGLGFNVHLTAPKDEGSYPVVLFVSGFSGLAPAFTYSTFITELANKGYIVVGLDHIKAPNYPKQGADFLAVMEWAKAGNLTQALKDAKIKGSPDLDRVAVMGQSAGNHVVGQGLEDGCSLAKAQVMIDPVDGFDPFGMVHKEDLITPGKKLTYTTPTLLLDNELDPVSKNKLFPACAPAKLGAPRWFDAVAGPVFNVNASKYGHIDCLNDLYIKAGTVMCPSDKTTDKKAYRGHLASTIDLFLDGVFQGHSDNFNKLQDASSFGIDVTLKHDLKDMAVSDIKAGCSNQGVVV